MIPILGPKKRAIEDGRPFAKRKSTESSSQRLRMQARANGESNVAVL